MMEIQVIGQILDLINIQYILMVTIRGIGVKKNFVANTGYGDMYVCAIL